MIWKKHKPIKRRDGSTEESWTYDDFQVEIDGRKGLGYDVDFTVFPSGRKSFSRSVHFDTKSEALRFARRLMKNPTGNSNMILSTGRFL